MKRLAAALLLVLAGCSRGPVASQPSPTPTREGVLVHAGSGTLTVEVAASRSARSLGLMHRTSLPADAGMLFLFPEPRAGGFWMRDTLIPLSIAFVARSDSGDLEVAAVLDMEPCRADPCPSYRPGMTYDLAVEANQGWFARHDVGAGTPVRIEGTLPVPS